jgi:hypothetical protein
MLHKDSSLVRDQKYIPHWGGLARYLTSKMFRPRISQVLQPRPPELVKGYGDTYALGSRNYESLMRTLSTLRQMDNAAARLKALREAALADDTGKNVENVLAELNLLPGGRQ